MLGTAPWVIAAVFLIAFGASFSELQRMRFSEVTRHQFHDHSHVRQFIIRAALSGLRKPIVILGDSIAEMARFPETIDGKPVVNAGIGGASVEDIAVIAPVLLSDSKPSLLVVVIGTNNAADGLGSAYTELLSKLKAISPQLLAVAVPPQQDADQKNAQIRTAADRSGVRFVSPALPDGSSHPDGVHLSAAGYRNWTPAIVAAISAAGS